MIQDAFWGILIPFLGTSLGAGCVFFLKNSLRDGIQRAHGLCRRSDGGGIGMELADPGYGAGRKSGQAGIFPGGGGFLAGYPVFAAAGPSHPASAPEQLAGRRAKKPAPAHHHDGSGGDAAQHPGGYGGGRSLCRIPCRNGSDHRRRGAGTSLGIAIQNFPEGAIIPCHCGRKE